MSGRKISFTYLDAMPNRDHFVGDI